MLAFKVQTASLAEIKQPVVQFAPQSPRLFSLIIRVNAFLSGPFSSRFFLVNLRLSFGLKSIDRC